MAYNNITGENLPGYAEQPKPLTLTERKELGKQKKLWRLEIFFNELSKNQTCRYQLDNRTGQEIRDFRSQVFSIGLMVQMEPGMWVIAPPAAVIQVNIWKQDKFFDVL